MLTNVDAYGHSTSLLRITLDRSAFDCMPAHYAPWVHQVVADETPMAIFVLKEGRTTAAVISTLDILS